MSEEQHDDLTYGVVEILRNEELGSGSYGAVYRARCDELLCAAKVLHPILYSEEPGGEGEHRLLRQFHQECIFLRNLRHPNIVQYLGIYIDRNERVLLMELMDGNLTNYLKQNETTPLPHHTAIDICYDVALALAYLHSNYIVHRDVSSNNILLLGERRVKVGDFGVSRLINPHRQQRSSLTRCPGNSVYMPPEATDDSQGGRYSEKLDCFSYGVLCVQVFTRRFPNPTAHLVMTDRANLRSVVSEVTRRQEHIDMIDHSNPFLQTVLQCLSDSPEDRPSAQEICHRLVGVKEEPKYVESMQQGNDRPMAVRRDDEEEIRRRDFIQDLEEQLRQLRQEKEHLQHLIRNIRAEVTHKNHEIEEKARTIAQFERERLQQRQELSELTNCLEETQEQLLRSEQQSQADIMGLQQTIHEKDITITELSQLNIELRKEVGRMEQQISHQKALSEQIASLRISTRYSGEIPHQIRREPDATICQGVIYFKYFWGKHIISYDIKREKWSELPACPNSSFSMAIINGYLTTIGGKQPNLDPTNSLWSFINSEWVEEFSPMPTKRYWTIATSYNSVKSYETTIIVIGGETEGHTILCTVEVFYTGSKQWYTACSLPQPFDSATATVHQDQLFLAGGSSKNTARCVLSCSVPHLLESCRAVMLGGDHITQRAPGVWFRICDLPFYKMTTTNLGAHLLAVGGKTKDSSPSSAVFVYDRKTDTWIEIGHLARARSSCFAVSLPQNEVMVVGGLVDNEGKEPTSSVEFLAFE